MTTEEVNALDSVWRARGLKPVFLAMICAFGAWALLLPVVPTAVLDAGGSETLAGLTTGVFMLFTVVTQVFTPMLLRKVGYTAVLSVSAFLLGFPAVGYLLGMSAPAVLTVSAIRGVGFGALTVAEAAIVAELVPIRLLGRATGLVGIMIGLAQMVALPAGMWLVQRIGYDAVYLIAGGIGLLALVACQGIPPIPPPTEKTSETDHIYVPIWRLVLVPALALMFVTTAYGAITNFLPASMRELDAATGAALGGLMLGVMNFASMLSRYYAGRVMDKVGQPGTVMIRFQIIAALGVFVMAVILFLDLPVWWMALAALLYGAGFGAVQNEALTMMFYRLPRTKTSEAAAIWNIAYDGGTGIGSTFYGMLLTTMAFAPMFGIAAGVIMLGLVVTLLDRQLGRHRVVEVNNLAARLQSVQAPRRYNRGAKKR
ncbi:MFS transporter [Corynebacterium sp. p3-SID1056]|uniref:MFS transporter n=1 Tax=Corynebacterium sp. p3-SID1056 TaxID=2916092 RepID=UPI0021A27153|nr:MFS transporter [Corynebacterium sp. p3-SID1056]MCT2337887.1 MFS transporter [Corynebacterium sp. p3-SID1056]